MKQKIELAIINNLKISPNTANNLAEFTERSAPTVEKYLRKLKSVGIVMKANNTYYLTNLGFELINLGNKN